MKDCLWLWHFFLFQNRVYEGKVEVEMTAERRWPDGDVTGSFVNSRICGPLSHFRIMKKKSSNKCTLHLLCPFDRDRMKRSITLTSCVGPKRSSCTKRPCSSLCWLVYAKLTQLESSRGDTSMRPLRSGCRPACKIFSWLVADVGGSSLLGGVTPGMVADQQIMRSKPVSSTPYSLCIN